MRRRLRLLGTVLTAAGALLLVWAVVVWQWQDPFTALYTTWKQHELAGQYAKRAATFRPPVDARTSLAAERQQIAVEAADYRRDTRRGQAIGRIIVPRIALNMIL